MDLSKLIAGIEPTEKLYLSNPYKKESRANVLVSKQERKNVYVVLDKSIFHPKGGGQPTDLGLLKGDGFQIRLKKVMERKGVLVHFGKLEGRPPLEGEGLTCFLDWKRRHLIMRLHTAGHVLDYAVKEVYGEIIETLEALHGPPEAYTEYKGRSPSEDQIVEIQRIANDVVKEARRVDFIYVNEDELRKAAKNAPNLNRLPKAGKYRLVVIEGINAIPCMGTHVRNTSEIGSIELVGAESTKQGFKLYYSVS